MAEIMGTGSLEEEILRQQREAEERARQEAERAQAEAEKAAAEAEAASAESAKAAQEAAEKNQQAAQQAADEAAAAAGQGAKIEIGPTNRPFTEEQSFLLHQRKAVRDTDTDIVKIGELDRLPESLEPHRAMLEERNRKGKIIPSDVNDWGTNRIDINFGSIKDNDQAAYFATTLATDSDKLSFFKEYAARSGQNSNSVISYAEDLLGTKLFSEPQTMAGKNKQIMKGLTGYELIGYDAKSIDMNSASAAEVMRAIRAEPDDTIRSDMADWFEKATKQEGNRFYGVSFDKTQLKKFQSTAALTGDMYDEFVGYTENAFDPTPGHEAENEQTYQGLLSDIENGGYTDYQKYHLRRALDRAYLNQMGHAYEGSAVSGGVQPVSTPGTPVASEATNEEGAAQKGGFGRWIDGLMGKEEKQAPAPDMTPGFGGYWKEGFNAEIPQAEEAQIPAAGTINLENDPVRAVQYVKYHKGNLLDESTRNAVNTLVGSSPAAKVILGLDYTGSQELYEQAADDPFALARANQARSDYLTGNVSGIMGSTLGGYLTRSRDKNFPFDLKDDAEGAILQVALEAERAYEMGEFVYDRENENMYEAYCKQFPQALTTVRGVFQTVDEMRKEQRRLSMLSADKSEKDAAELLKQSRLALQTENFTQADIDRVAENSPVVTMQSAMQDSFYRDTFSEIALDRTFSDGEDGGWYNDQTVDYLMRMGLTPDLTSIAAMQYKDVLQGYVEDELLKDYRVAQGLGYENLDAYYAKQGGFSIDNLYARATNSMQDFGSSVTQEEIEEVKSSLYKGTGEGIAWGEDALAGGAYGLTSVAADALESFWMQDRAAVDGRADAVANVRNDYMKRYNYAIASYMCEQDWRNYLATGAYPSEEYKQYVETYLNSGEDVFQLGPVPSSSEALLQGAVRLDKAAEKTGEWAQQFLNEKKGKVFEVASTTTSNLALQTMASILTGATGSGLFGTFASFGMMSAYPNEMREQLSKGKSLSEANAMGAVHAVTTAMAEAATSGELTNKLLRATGLMPLAQNGLSNMGSVGATKSVWGMAKLFGKNFGKGALEMAGGELVTDELKDRWLWQAAGGALEAGFDGANLLEAVGAGLANVDVGGTLSEVVREIPEGLIYMSPMIIMGGAGEGFTATRRAAQELAATGSAESAKKFVDTLNAEMGPQQKAELNREAKEVQKGQMAAGILMTDQEIKPTLESAQKAQEQADSHTAEAQASQARMDTAQKSYFERKEAGDIDGANSALREYVKAKQGLNEHTREAEQKKTETDRLMTKAVGQALDKANIQMRARHVIAKSQIQEEIENDVRTLETQIMDREARIQSMQEELERTSAEGDEEAFGRLLEEQGVLSVEIADLEERRTGILDAQAAREMEQAMQRDATAQEKADMAPVYKDLRVRPIYVDDRQAGEIKSLTGLTIPQFNRKYGFSLTTDKAKGKTSLDGSFFADLAEQAPGYIDAQTAHPEEEIVRLAERKKELSGVQASIGETNAEAYVTDTTYGTDDPVTQQIASRLQKNTGITLVTANLEDGKRGWFDRRNKQLVLSNKLGAGEMRRTVVLHELTHYIENSPNYKLYREAVLKAAYEGDEKKMEADREDLREEYAAHGVTLDEEGADAELVAAATERVIEGSEAFFEGLINNGKRPFLTRVYTKVKQFLARQKAKKAGKEELAHYDHIQRAHDLLEQTLKRAGKTAHADGETRYAMGWTTNGRQYVEIENDILKGLPESEWPKAAKEALKKYSGGIPVGRNTVYVSQKTYGEWTKSGDARRIQREDPQAYEDKMRAAGNADEIVWASTDYINEEVDHERKDGISEFARGNVLLSISGRDYEANVVIGKRKDGSLLLYDVTHITPTNVQKKRPQNEGGSSVSVPTRQSVASDTIVHNDGTGVKSQSTQSGVQLSIGVRQFGNNSAKRADFISDRVKEMVKDTAYEQDTNREQVKRATQRLDADGLDRTASELLAKDKGRYTADDNALAFVAMAEATRNGDETTAALLAMRMNEEAGEQGRALQSVQIAGRLTPEGAMGEMIRKANRTNEAHGVPAGSFPVGEEAPKKGGEETGEDGTTTRTPEAVEAVYLSAEEINGALLKLSGEISYDNPWELPLSDKQMKLIRDYKLTGEKLPGVNYNVATVKQRMLAAIVSAGPEVQGDGMLALCQQLEAMKRGHAVVTKADLTYTAGQMAEFRMLEGEDAKMPETQAGKMALGRAYQAQDNVRQESFFTKWSALRFMNMLSAPATFVRNVSSNVLSGGLEGVATAVATAADKRVARKTGTRTTAIATKQEKKAGKNAFAKETAQTFCDYFVSHVDTGHGRKYAMGGQGRVFENEFLEGMRNLVDFAMQVGDRPFFESCYAQEMAIIKRLGMKKTQMQDGKIVSRSMTEAEMHEEATARALKRVFQEDNSVIDALNGLKTKGAAADLFISTLMPFIKTPTNVAMRAIEYSPIGFGMTLARKAVYGMDSGKEHSISQRDYVMGIGRGLTGTGLMVAGYALAASGMIGFGRGEEENDRRRGVLSALGEPYSMYIQIGDTKREIDWALPMASAIAMGAELWRNLEDGEGLAEAAFSGILSGVGDQIMSTPMLSAMNDIFRGYDSTEDIFIRLAKTGATSLLNQTFSPSVIRAIAKATDPYVRDTSDSSAVWSALKQNLFQYWPGIRQILPIKTDITGDHQLQSGYWNPESEHGSRIMQYLDSFLTPTATIGEKNDPQLLELLDLSYRTDESAFLPTDLISAKKYELTVTKTLAKSAFKENNAITLELTDEEKREANAAYGNLLFNGDGGRAYVNEKRVARRFSGLRAVMQDEALYSSGNFRQRAVWSKLSDEEKVELADKMRNEAKNLIILDVARRKGIQ